MAGSGPLKKSLETIGILLHLLFASRGPSRGLWKNCAVFGFILAVSGSSTTAAPKSSFFAFCRSKLAFLQSAVHFDPKLEALKYAQRSLRLLEFMETHLPDRTQERALIVESLNQRLRGETAELSNAQRIAVRLLGRAVLAEHRKKFERLLNLAGISPVLVRSSDASFRFRLMRNTQTWQVLKITAIIALALAQPTIWRSLQNKGLPQAVAMEIKDPRTSQIKLQFAPLPGESIPPRGQSSKPPRAFQFGIHHLKAELDPAFTVSRPNEQILKYRVTGSKDIGALALSFGRGEPSEPWRLRKVIFLKSITAANGLVVAPEQSSRGTNHQEGGE